MERLNQILRDRALSSVEPAQTVCDVARKMSDLNVGAILVMEGGKLCGLFSERDLMTRVIVAGLDPASTTVGRVMSRDLATIEETSSVEQALGLMHERKCRHLPVTRDNAVVGLISMRDLMNYELDRKTDEIQHMRAYIAGNV